MLEVQKYIKDNGINKLKEEYGVEAHYHPTLPLVGLKYSQINSAKQKYSQIVRECRGVTLELDTWKLVAKGFNRFFNYGESKDHFDWNNFICEEKVDGTCILVFFYRGEWHTKTCGGWTGSCSMLNPKSFDQLFRENFRGFDKLEEKYTYVFELCSMENKVVRVYEKPTIYFLGAFDGEQEIGRYRNRLTASKIEVESPTIYYFNREDDVVGFLQKSAEKDPTFEGFVAVDKHMNRLKIKSKSYLLLHRAKSTSLNKRDILNLILRGEQDEILSYFPEYKPYFEDVEKRVKRIESEAVATMKAADRSTPKNFALSIANYPGKSILFYHEKAQKPLDVRQFLRDNQSYGEKLIYGTICRDGDQ